MFEKVVLRRSEVGPVISLGEIAEALLFYQRVHIIIDYALLNELVEKLGIEGLIRLVSRPNVNAVYCEEMLAVQTEKVGVSEFHSYAAITFAGDQESGQLHSHLARLPLRDGQSL